MLNSEDLVAALPGLQRYALALTRDADSADDLVQETVAKALARAGSFRGESSPATWLHRILHHAFVDGQRARQPVVTGDLRLAAVLDAAWADDQYTVNPEQVMLRASTRDSLLDGLVRLPYDHRAALLLHDVEGHTSGEVAQIQGVSLAAAKQRIRRGRAMLVSALDQEFDRRRARQGVPMNCFDARAKVGDYLDGELPAGERAQLEGHLRACPTCPGLFSALVGVQEALGELRDASSVVPPELAQRVRRRLGDTSSVESVG